MAQNQSIEDIVYQALASDLLGRSKFAERVGMSFQDPNTGEFKRDIYAALGYQRQLFVEDYVQRYRRGGLAERLVEVYPKATWSGGATLVEDDKPDSNTAFEQASKDLFQRLDFWTKLMRADILSGLGQYGVLLLGAAGDMRTPLPKGADNLIFVKPYIQTKATILTLVETTTDPRFGLPEFYEIDIGTADATTTESKVIKTHWSRVIHIAEGLLEDELHGKPVLESVWNYFNDLEKITGGGSESAWKRMNPGMQLDLDPETELSEQEQDDLNDELDEYDHGMRRNIRTRGIKLKILAAEVAGFSDNADTIVRLISSSKGVPNRILTGSEMGELASTQDRINWADNVAVRRNNFGEPLVRAVVKRFQDNNILPEADYTVAWPEVDELDEEQKSKFIETIALANKAQFESEGQIIVKSDEMRHDILGKRPLPPMPKPEPVEPVQPAVPNLPVEDEDAEDEQS